MRIIVPTGCWGFGLIKPGRADHLGQPMEGMRLVALSLQSADEDHRPYLYGLAACAQVGRYILPYFRRFLIGTDALEPSPLYVVLA